MSCCGKKRAEFTARKETLPTPEVITEPAPPHRPAPPRIFEFTGPGTLTLTGISTGATYRFERPGFRVEVAYEDAFAMMAEPELRIAIS